MKSVIVTHRSCFSGWIEMDRAWACLPSGLPSSRGRSGRGSLAGVLLNLLYWCNCQGWRDCRSPAVLSYIVMLQEQLLEWLPCAWIASGVLMRCVAGNVAVNLQILFRFGGFFGFMGFFLVFFCICVFNEVRMLPGRFSFLWLALLSISYSWTHAPALSCDEVWKKQLKALLQG